MGNVLTDFEARLQSGKPVIAGWCHFSDPMVSEAMAREAYDAIIYDMQHGQIGLDAVMRSIPLVTALGKAAIARIPVGHFAEGSRLLDAGASAVIAPMINTVEDARLFASVMKFPPMGERSWGANRGLWLSGLKGTDYLQSANGFTKALAMIETREAMAVIDDILMVPGIDGVFIGPGDLSIALSNGAFVDPLHASVTEAIDHIIKRAKAHKKQVWAYAVSGKRAAEMFAMGLHCAAISSDVNLLRAASALEIAAAQGKAASGSAGGGY
jgi:4-hydroxy-2-oxoheptanedioate aldolase